MFSKLVARNSQRNRKNNTLYFSSMVLSVISFYIILSLSHQDVISFLTKMESDAVNRLLSMVPLFYVFTLFILLMLVYFASSVQMERRSHEFGVYLTLGMKRKTLFRMILMEDVRDSLIALAIGLPIAVILSEAISLVTVRLIGIGIVGHRFTLSLSAILFTVIGFSLVKLLAILVLSKRVVSKEIGELLFFEPVGAKKQINQKACFVAFISSVGCLGLAYYLGLSEHMWENLIFMFLVLFSGTLGTILLFYALRFGIEWVMKHSKKKKLHDFNFRQIQEGIVSRSTLLAICSLLLFSAFCLAGYGSAVASQYIQEDDHVLDYTFWPNETMGVQDIRQTLASKGLDGSFQALMEIKLGSAYQSSGDRSPIDPSALNALVSQMDDQQFVTLMSSVSGDDNLISESGYNELLKAAGKKPLELGDHQLGLYLGTVLFDNTKVVQSFSKLLKGGATVSIAGVNYSIDPAVQQTNFVTDRIINIAFAWIVPDELFDQLTAGEYSSYLGGVLQSKLVEEKGLMMAISDINTQLAGTGLSYESYIQNAGRQIFYIVSSAYLTLYLATIFLIIGNTIIGIQFLMEQQKAHRRYQSLIHLGADYKTLCRAANAQINGYFGIPIFVALLNAAFGTKTLFQGILPYSYREQSGKLLIIVAIILVLIAIVEAIYIRVVKQSSSQYLWTLMKPAREE
ncbi:FtsX-like permease family protein [Olegusella massiliensis]|uniref:FtsX-like permease family protein n=1 Tax=Olegusella massiliensis TaxID=1776381 RepID=UPI0023FA1133|nr:FtsX-like permease family protein [Olegusella massiliensis]